MLVGMEAVGATRSVFTHTGLLPRVNRDVRGDRLHRRARLSSRGSSHPDALQGAQRLESRHSQRHAQSRRLVGASTATRSLRSSSNRSKSQTRRWRPAPPPMSRHAPDQGGASCSAADVDWRLQLHPHQNGVGSRECTGWRPVGGGADILRPPTTRSSPPAGISTFGARCAGKSRATRPPRKPARPISTTPSFPRRRCLPPPISIFARRIPCTTCSIARSRNTKKRSISCGTNSTRATVPPVPLAVRPRTWPLPKRRCFTTEAQEINVGVQRAQYEHAIAMLIGRPPAELTIAPHLLTGSIPKIPVAFLPHCSNGVPTSPPRNEPCSRKTR